MTVSDPVAGAAARQHLVGLVVDDLRSAAEHLARAYRVGPFLAIPHVEFDELTYEGEPFLRDPGLPTYIVVHHDNPFLARFDLAVAQATRDWDRRDALPALDSIVVD